MVYKDLHDMLWRVRVPWAVLDEDALSIPIPEDNVRSAVSTSQPKLLECSRQALCVRHCSHRIEETYCHWGEWFTHFHNVRHSVEHGGSCADPYTTPW